MDSLRGVFLFGPRTMSDRPALNGSGVLYCNSPSIFTPRWRVSLIIGILEVIAKYNQSFLRDVCSVPKSLAWHIWLYEQKRVYRSIVHGRHETKVLVVRFMLLRMQK